MRPPPRHAVIHLPVLAPAEAVRLIGLLERVIDGIWRAHGPAIEAWRDDAQRAPAAPRPAAPLPADDDALF
jgi:hypothetical protein